MSSDSPHSVGKILWFKQERALPHIHATAMSLSHRDVIGVLWYLAIFLISASTIPYLWKRVSLEVINLIFVHVCVSILINYILAETSA